MINTFQRHILFYFFFFCKNQKAYETRICLVSILVHVNDFVVESWFSNFNSTDTMHSTCYVDSKPHAHPLYLSSSTFHGNDWINDL